jgi:ATP-dependent exoDNAse (exonuclease V) alpha subunit
VDEAAMVGDRQLAELVGLAERDDVKLVLIGDHCQLQPIEAGAPLRMLGERIGKVLMVEYVRQDAE